MIDTAVSDEELHRRIQELIQECNTLIVRLRVCTAMLKIDPETAIGPGMEASRLNENARQLKSYAALLRARRAP